MGSTAAGGDGIQPQGDGQGTTDPAANQPPVGASAQGSGGAPAGGQQGAGAGGGSFDRTKLSPALQNLSEEQINGLVDTMFSAIANRAGGGEPPAAAAQQQQASDPEPDYREYFDPGSDKFNPKAAVADMVQRNYGGLIRDIGQRAVTGTFGRFREEYPDFKDFEKDITQALANTGVVNPTDQQITALYFTAKGQRAAVSERAARAKQQASPPPSAPAIGSDHAPREVPLDEDEKRVARRMFPNAQDPEKAYREHATRLESGQTTMKVPMGGGVRR